MNKLKISASILAADFTRLGEETTAALNAGVDFIHFDVMDHHFVPNLSFGPVICKSLRKAGIDAPIDVHLMVEHPEHYIEPFAECGAHIFIFHPETVSDVFDTIKHIHASGMKAGLAFNPDKPINISEELFNYLDMILIMSVFPGFAGQTFIEETTAKISDTRRRINELDRNITLGVDGGIKANNIHKIVKAGADFFVVGSGLFHADDYTDYVKTLRQKMN